jgi:hypothetical protein
MAPTRPAGFYRVIEVLRKERMGRNDAFGGAKVAMVVTVEVDEDDVGVYAIDALIQVGRLCQPAGPLSTTDSFHLFAVIFKAPPQPERAAPPPLR